MKISYNWLQNYFGGKLPAPEKLADVLTFHVFEIESVEKVGEDTVLDVKVLPDRARYALSHKGIAYEISAILNIPEQSYPTPPLKTNLTGDHVLVEVKDSRACSRYMARNMEGITMAITPDWLKQTLEVLGQRSINSIVDAANLTLLDIGQPLHVFDADKIEGTLTVRFAHTGERITTLDNKEVALDESILVIADQAGPLAIAGIKGGMRAAVTESTKNIIIESANFDASLIRKTSTKIGIRTDASKHYENAISPDFVLEGMEKISSLIETINTPKTISPLTDIYPHPVEPHTLSVSAQYIQDRLGIPISQEEISGILNRLSLKNSIGGDIIKIIVPTFRGDLLIPEDIVEEVGRIYGYEKIPAESLPPTTFTPHIVKGVYYSDKIRDILVGLGFSEVYTYVFGEKGDIELEKALASDKNYLRATLKTGIEKSLELNAKNADLLGLDTIKIFEIGSVFTKEGEHKELALAIKYIKKQKNKETDELQKIIKDLEMNLGKISTEVAGNTRTVENNILIINLEDLFKELPEPTEYTTTEIKKEVIKYKPISVYPFSVRDIAVFTPEGTPEQDVRDIIEKNAGSLLVRNTRFDVFTKTFPDGTKKTSYAFRMVFQSEVKTLTEDEINSIMNAITTSMNSREGWQVR